MPVRNPVVKDKSKESEISKKFWEAAERAKQVERVDEKEVFRLSEKEAKKCRYEMVDQNFRMVECTVHRTNFSHGVRLFPPHLWDLRKGKVYRKIDNEWVLWTPNIKENLQRFEEEDNS